MGAYNKFNEERSYSQKRLGVGSGYSSDAKNGQVNDESLALGIGAGKEVVLFYLANQLRTVYATDLYTGESDWKVFAPSDFPENPGKYAPFPYREERLKALKMDGKNLNFSDNIFDIAFSFSSIEHFGGDRHSGALKCLQEIERVLKPGGIATIATDTW